MLTIEIIKVVAIIMVGGWALFRYNETIISKKADTLDNHWKTFIESSDFSKVFALQDELAYAKPGSPEFAGLTKQLDNIDAQVKWKYLAFLYRTAVLFSAKQIISKYAIYKFHWLFYYVYTDSVTSLAFWNSIGGKRQIERDSKSWKYSLEMAKSCNDYIQS